MSIGRHSLVTAVSQLAVAAVAAAYGFLIPRRFGGAPGMCDAFFVGYNVYMLLGIFSVSLRVSVVPPAAALLDLEAAGAARPLSRLAGLSGTVAVLFGGIGLFVAGSSPLLATLLSPGFDELGHRETTFMIAGFAPAIAAQGVAFYLSGVAGAMGRFALVSGVMVLAAAAGAAIFVFTPGLGLYSAVLGLLAFNLLWGGLLFWSLRARGLGFRLRGSRFSEVRGHLSTILAGAAPYVLANGLFLASQSLSTRHGVGSATCFSFAYMVTGVAVAVTGQAIGVVASKTFSEHSIRDRQALRETLLATLEVAGVVIAAVMGLLAIVVLPVGPILFARFDATSTLPHISQVFTRCVWWLAPGGWALALFSTVVPAALAVGLGRGFLAAAASLTVLHIGASFFLVRAMAIEGLAAALSVSFGLLLVTALLLLGRALGPRLVAAALARVLPMAALSALLASAATWAAVKSGSGVLASAALGVCFVVLYSAATRIIRKETFGTIKRHCFPWRP